MRLRPTMTRIAATARRSAAAAGHAAIITGWVIGNTLGAVAAYRKGGFDKVLMPVSIFARVVLPTPEGPNRA